MKVSQLVDRVLKGDFPHCLKYGGCLYYPEGDNNTYINIYGVNLISVLIAEVEAGTRVNDLDIEEVF